MSTSNPRFHSRKKTWPTELRNWGLTKMASLTLRHAQMATISLRHANALLSSLNHAAATLTLRFTPRQQTTIKSQAWSSTRAWSSTMSFAVPSLRRKPNPAALSLEQAPPSPAAPPVPQEISSDEEPAPTEAGDRQLELCLDSQALESCAAFDAEQALATGASLSLAAEAASFDMFTDDDSIFQQSSVASFI